MARQVEISDEWARRIQSPFFYLIAVFTGISQSFCLYWIYQCGKAGYPLYHPLMLANFAVIWLVFWFYAGIAGQVITQIRRRTTAIPAGDETANTFN